MPIFIIVSTLNCLFTLSQSNVKFMHFFSLVKIVVKSNYSCVQSKWHIKYASEQL